MEDQGQLWEFFNKKNITRILAWILTPGQDLNIREPKTGSTPLIWASRTNNTNMAGVLIDKGADINATNLLFGDSALSTAITRRQVDLAKLLIEKGANLEQQNKRGETPLISAVKTKSPEIVGLLIEKGVDVAKRDKTGNTALDYAKTNEIRRLLGSTEPIVEAPAPPTVKYNDTELEPNLTDGVSRLSIDYITDQMNYSSSLAPDEKKLLISYTKFGDVVINNALQMKAEPTTSSRVVSNFRGVNPLKNLTTLTSSKLKDVRGGNIPEYLARFMTIVSKAPKLKEELKLYRGIGKEEDLPEQGNRILSTSLNPSVALGFKADNPCCFLNVTAKPGVKTIWMEPTSNFQKEQEILIVPPFKLDFVKVSEGIYDVTVSPTQYTRQAASSRRKSTRKTRKTRRRRA